MLGVHDCRVLVVRDADPCRAALLLTGACNVLRAAESFPSQHDHLPTVHHAPIDCIFQ